jgi:transposase
MASDTDAVIRIDEIWLSREPLDMRAGPDTALARVINRFSEAKPHTAYVFANKRANRMKVLVHDGFGIWLAARRLHEGKFAWTQLREGGAVALDAQQLQALVVGLPWQYAGRNHVIDRQ